MTVKHKSCIIVHFILFLGIQCILSAQEEIPDSLVRERINAIQAMLDNGKKGANIWWYGWIVAYGTATITQGALYFSDDKLSTHQDMVLGAGTTFLGMCGQLISPMTPGFAPQKLRNFPEGNPEENLKKLEEAEKLLKECATREKEGRSWKIHAMDGVVNLGCGLIVWKGFKRSLLESVINVAVNTAICEIQIFTQPVRAIHDYEKYCKKYIENQPLTDKDPKIILSFIMVPGSAGLRLRF